VSDLTPQEKISLFKSLFRGREDVFAMRWEKKNGSASGYTPVCLNEWKAIICNKLQSKKCKDCAHSQYIGINDQHIEQHLRGVKTYGIYPLLDDNTSYFIAADFDGADWQDKIIKFHSICVKYGLPAYIERSRSGNGGHAWIFFENKYPAYKSRSISINLLKEVAIIDQFEKDDCFDRLFPNQDALSGKGFGNLIALPLQGESRKNNNTVFLDPNSSLAPFIDQWEFLEKTQRVPVTRLDDLYVAFNSDDKQTTPTDGKLRIAVANMLFLNKSFLPKSLINFLKNSLNFMNSDFLIKKKIGASVYNVEKYFKLVQTFDENIAIPRGFLNRLTNFLKEKHLAYEIDEQRLKLADVNFEIAIKLFPQQSEAIDKMKATDAGVLVAPPGSGKTIIGLDIIAKQKQPALILVHKKQIFNQWLERIEGFLNIPKREIGQYTSNKKKLGEKITVAMVQTLNRIDSNELAGKFGLILVDECHHMPAKMFRNVITRFNPHYLYGLTATPKRKNNDTDLIFFFLGDIIHTIQSNYKEPNKDAKATPAPAKKSELNIVIKETSLSVPFKVRTDNVQTLYKIITFDTQRNQQIIANVQNEARLGKKCLILTERKEHVEVLNYYLKKEYETIVLTGDLTEKQRQIKVKQIQAGHFQILIATGQLIGEGTDFNNLDCLFLAYPFAFEGKLTQYIGRINRGLNTGGTIYDYNDSKIEYLKRFFKKRSAYYKKIL